MPKSKRDKKVSLTKTSKKGLLLKQKTIEEIRKCLSKYEHVFLFTVDNMRNTKLKDLRSEWKDSRFFFGKNKVMAIALGRTKSDEVEDQLNLISKRLKGQCGLLMTNRDVPDVLQWFKDFRETEFARSGFVATKDVILPQGPLEDFSHTIEPHLRKLGLPTSLERGVIHLIKEYQTSWLKRIYSFTIHKRFYKITLILNLPSAVKGNVKKQFQEASSIKLVRGFLRGLKYFESKLTTMHPAVLGWCEVCKKGSTLTPEQASILKLLGIQLAKFKVLIKCHWSKGKGFHKDLDVPSDDEGGDEDDDGDVLEDDAMEEDET